MAYWLTVHYPPRTAWEPGFVDPAIYLKEEKRHAGDDVNPGDLVFIYETKTGKPDEESGPLQVGRQGIVALCRTTTGIYQVAEAQPTIYEDGEQVLWNWVADMEIISDNGNLVDRRSLNGILDFQPGNVFRAIGAYHSGLKQLSEVQFQSILELYLPGTDLASL